MNNKVEEKLEVGGNILSYCGKCKADSMHVVFAMEESKISKLTCEGCGARHNYRKPKSLIEENKAARKASKSARASTSSKVRKPSKKINDILADYDPNILQNYSVTENYKDSSIIKHPSFGVGVVTKKIGQEKIEVQFEDGSSKLLVINWVVKS